MKKIYLFIMVICLSISVLSQAASFDSAQEAFEAGEYERTIQLLEAYEKANGTSPRLESLKALSYRDLGKPREAYKALLTYFKLTESMDLSSNEAHKNLIELREALAAQFEKEFDNKRTEIQEQRNREADSQIQKQENSSAKKSEDPLAELEMWKKVQESNTAANYYLFIQSFPNSVYVKTAREKMNASGDPEWNQIKDTKDPLVLKEYLKNNPNTIYAQEVNAKMKMLAESIIAWERIKESKNYEDFSKYLNQFPEGAYAREAADKRVRQLYMEKYVRRDGVTPRTPEENIRILTELINLNPNFDTAYNMRGANYAYLGFYNDCVRDTTKAISLNKELGDDDPFSQETRANCYAKLGQNKLALDDYAQAIQSFRNQPNLLSISLIVILKNRGKLFLEIGEFESALTDLNEAIKLYFDRLKVNYHYTIADTYRLRSLVYIKLGKKNLAKDDIKKCKEIPDSKCE